jgi:hypothetical protein
MASKKEYTAAITCSAIYTHLFGSETIYPETLKDRVSYCFNRQFITFLA